MSQLKLNPVPALKADPPAALKLVPIFRISNRQSPDIITITAAGKIHFTGKRGMEKINFKEIDSFQAFTNEGDHRDYSVYLIGGKGLPIKMSKKKYPNGTIIYGCIIQAWLKSAGIKYPSKVLFEVITYEKKKIIVLKTTKTGNLSQLKQEAITEAREKPARKKAVPKKATIKAKGKTPSSEKVSKGVKKGIKRGPYKKKAAAPSSPAKNKKVTGDGKGKKSLLPRHRDSLE